MDLSACINGLLPEFILLIGACAVLFCGMGPLRNHALHGPLALAVIVVALLAAICPHVAGSTQAPPGLVLGSLLSYVRFGALGVGLLILLCNMHVPVNQEKPEYFALILFSILGLQLTAAANDILVLFFAIELVSIPTYILIALSREDKKASEASMKYFFLGAFASALMVYGFSFLYGSLGGHTTMVAAASQAPAMSTVAASLSAVGPYVLIGILLALAGVFFKVAAVPFHFYAADVYQGAASPVTGLLGFLPKFAGFVAACKLLSILNWDLPLVLMWVLWAVAALTMTIGNTLALMQSNVKRMLAYSSIAHSGYMLVGLLVGPALVATELADRDNPMRDGIAAMLFYMVIYGAMNLGAFAVLAALKKKGEPAEQLSDIQGLSSRKPALALALAVCCFSLMGFPPTAGPLGKVYIFSSAFSVPETNAFCRPLIILAIIGVLNSAVGAAYYLRIIATCYNKKAEGEVEQTGGNALRWSIALCSIAMIILFACPTKLRDAAGKASAQLAGQTHSTEVRADSK